MLLTVTCSFCLPLLPVCSTVWRGSSTCTCTCFTLDHLVRAGPYTCADCADCFRCAEDKTFLFLSDNRCPEHIYYRWKLFSVLQGDRVNRWNKECFRMFKSGSTWQPPEEDQLEQLEEVEKGHLSTVDRDKFEDILRAITPERSDVAKAMVICFCPVVQSHQVQPACVLLPTFHPVVPQSGCCIDPRNPLYGPVTFTYILVFGGGGRFAQGLLYWACRCGGRDFRLHL